MIDGAGSTEGDHMRKIDYWFGIQIAVLAVLVTSVIIGMVTWQTAIDSISAGFHALTD